MRGRNAVALMVWLAGCAPRAQPVAPATPAPVPSPYTAAQLAEAVEISDVAISPRGDEIAFVSDRSGSLEVWTAAIRGGTVSPPVQRTYAKETAGGLEYSANGDLVFQMDHGGDERYDLWILRKGTKEPELLAGTSLAEQGAFFSPDGTKLAYMADTEKPFQFDLVVRDLASGRVTSLTHEPVNVYGGVWSRDGRLVVGTVTPDDQKGELIVVDVETRKTRRIAPPREGGILWPQAFLPSGRLLATTVNESGFTQLCLVDVSAGTVALAGTREWDIEGVAATKGDTIVYARNVRGESELVVGTRVDSGRPALDVLTKGGVITDIAVDDAGARAVFVREASERPSELVLVDVPRRDSTVAVPAYAGGIELGRLAKAQLRSFPSFDRKQIDAFVWKPSVDRLGSPPPLVIHVHGGPNGQARPGFYPSIQALTEAGFVVAAPNYRGSTGYGRAFEDANNKDWGGGDLKDLLAVVEGLARIGMIDRSRVGITGGSYGGYLTLRALTATPREWGAGVALYGMPDLVKDYELTIDRFGTWYETEMGTPKTHPELFRERSPIHSIDAIVAPLLVLQGANDTNVPQWESDLVVDELKKRGRTVEYVVYPNEGHGFTHRENRLDSMQRTVDWFVTHLGQPRGDRAAR